MKPKAIARPPKPPKVAPPDKNPQPSNIDAQASESDRAVQSGKLTFAEVHAIAPTADCPFEELGLPELLNLIDEEDLNTIKAEWKHRNRIDGVDEIRCSDELLAKVLRWKLRGMEIDFAIRKTRSDECYEREVRHTAAIVDRLAQHPSPVQSPILKSN
jgi:hypothetical protein